MRHEVPLAGLKCCRDETDARPYMAEIVRELDGIRSVLPEGEDLLSTTSMEMGSSATLPNSASMSLTGEIFDSSHASNSGHDNSGIPSGMVAPR